MGLPAGQYVVAAFSRSGYITQLYGHGSCIDCSPADGAPVTVAAGAAVTGINFALPKGARITGTVSDAFTGQPLSNVTVRVLNSSGSGLDEAQTDSIGRYITPAGLPPGNYYLRTFNDLGYVNQAYNGVACVSCNVLTSGTPIQLSGTTTVTGADFSLSVGARISGRVTSAGGQPLSNVTVEVYTQAGGFISSGTTSTDGDYSVIGLPPGTYFARTANSASYVRQLYSGIQCLNCAVTTGTPIPLATGAAVSNVNFTLTAGGSIAGRITDAQSGVGLSGVNVNVVTTANQFVVGAVTDASGNYSLTGIPTGTYYARTANGLGYINEVYPDSPSDCCGVTSGTQLVIGTGTALTNINIGLVKGARLSGRVTNAATGAGVQARVQVFNASGTSLGTTTTDSSGNFTTAAFPAGTVYARSFNTLNLVNRLYNSIECIGCTVTTGTPITAAVDTITPNINLALQPGGGSVSGQITNAATGAALSGVNVNLYDSTGKFIASGTADSAGNYTSDVVLPGTYFARTNNVQGFVERAAGGEICAPCNVPGTSTPIVVTANTTTTGINFALTPGGAISGSVRDTNTLAGINAIRVDVYNSSGLFVKSAFSSSSGAFTASGLLAGTYFARAVPLTGYTPQQYSGLNCLSCGATSGTGISVTVGDTTTGIQFSLTPAGSISGRVTTLGGASISGAQAQLLDSNGQFVTNVSANGSGDYTIAGIPAGVYYVRTINSSGYVNQIYQGQPADCCGTSLGTSLTVTAGSSRTGVDFALAQGGTFSGRVVSAATGQGIGSVTVSIFTSTGSFVAAIQTDANGNYASQGLAAGNYVARTYNTQFYTNVLYPALACSGCDVTTGGSIAVSVGGSTPNINFALSSGAGYVSGRITNASGTGLSGQFVSFFNASNQYLGSAQTDATGNFTSESLSPGTYYATTVNSVGLVDGLYSGLICVGCSPSNGTAITVTANQTTGGVNFSLQSGGRIAGRVTAASSGAGIASIQLNVYSATGVQVGSAFTNSNGDYTTSAIPPGTYYLATVNSAYADELYSNIPCDPSCAVTTGNAITISAGDTSAGFNFALDEFNGTINGTIRDQSTLAPLSSVQVFAYNAVGTFVTQTQTNSSGAYTLSNLAAGSYYVRTGAAAPYFNEVYNNIPCPVNGCAVTSGNAVAVANNATVSNINFDLATGGIISGTVTTDAGVPLNGASVWILNEVGNTVLSTFTDSLGRYTASSLAAGSYRVRTSTVVGTLDEVWDNQICVECPSGSGTSVTVTDGGITSGINFALAAGGRIAGRVTATSGGAGVFPASVSVYSSAGAFLGSGSTDANGNYTVSRGLPTGSYFVVTSNNVYVDELYSNIVCEPSCTIASGTPVNVTQGLTTSGIDFVLDTGGRISGTVRDAGTSAALNSVTVTAYNASGSFEGSATTNASGTYSITGLAPGTHYVRTTSAPSGYINELYNDIACPSSCTVTTGTPVAVTLGVTTANIDFGLASGGTITGTITDEATGVPLAGVFVNVTTSNGTSVGTGGTNSAGVYSISGIATGSYLVRTYFNSSSHVNEAYNNIPCVNCASNTGTPVSITVGQVTSNINFALAKGAKISGRVFDVVTGLGIVNQYVAVYNASNTFVTSSSFVNADGSYSVDGLPSGTYFARTANGTSLGYVDELYDDRPCAFNSCTATSGTPLVVAAGQVRSNVDFGLNVGGRITGTVTSTASGQPLNNMAVWLYDSTGLLFLTQVNANASGVYTFTGLPSGSYFVRTSNAQGYLDEVYGNKPCCLLNSVISGNAVTVVGGQTTSGIDFSLATGGSVSGTVVDSSTGLGVASVPIEVYFSTGSGFTVVGNGSTNSSGVYSVGQLPTGSYLIRTRGNTLVDEVYDNITCINCSFTAFTPVAVTEGVATNNINFSLLRGGRITGTVIDAVTGLPVNSAQVVAFNASGSSVRSGFSNSSGAFTLTALPPGNYTVGSTATGYVGQLHANRRCPSLTCTVTAGDVVVAADGATTDQINFALVPGGRISGRVTAAATGAGIASYSVQALTSAGGFAASASTDASGNFTLTGLLSGSYYVQTTTVGNYINEVYDNALCVPSCLTQMGQPLAVVEGQVTTGVNIALSASGRIDGTVTDSATGQPIAGVSVALSTLTGAGITSATTTASGTFSFGALETGSYLVRTTSTNLPYINVAYPDITCLSCASNTGNPISVVRGASTPIALSMRAGGRIGGTVTDTAGAAVTAVSVQIFNSAGTSVGTVTPQTGGIYTTTGLPAGTYYARTVTSTAFAQRLYQDIDCAAGCTVTNGTPIQVVEGTTTGNVNFALPRSGRITGAITDAVTGAAIVGGGNTVRLFNAAGASVSSVSGATNGTYTVDVPSPGTYYIVVEAFGYLSQLYSGTPCPLTSCTVTSGTPISVTIDTVTPSINVAMIRGGGVSGRITDAGGSPISGVSVSAINTAGTTAASATTAADGTYTIFGLAGGNYFVRTSATTHVAELYQDIDCAPFCAVLNGASVAVPSSGTTTGIDFALARGGTVSGKVLVGGSGVQNVTLSLIAENSVVYRTVTSSNTGDYSFQGVLPGRYYLRTTNAQGWVDQLHGAGECPALSCNALAGTPIVVSDGSSVPSIDFNLALGVRLAGSVTEGATGLPVASLTVEVVTATGVALATTTTDAFGRYVTRVGLPAGTYYVRTRSAQGFVDELFGGAVCLGPCDPRVGTAIVAPAGQLIGSIDLSLDRGGRISGSLTNEVTGTPIAGLFVDVYDPTGRLVSRTSGSTTYTSSAGLTPGNYFVRTTVSGTALIDKLYNNLPCLGLCDVTAGTPVTVASGATTSNINFALTLGGRISGRVTLNGTFALSALTVEVYTAGGQLVSSGVTDAFGRYTTVNGMASGTYYVKTSNRVGYLDELFGGAPCVGVCAVTSGTPVVVSGTSTTSNIDIDLEKGARLAGVVTSLASGVPLAGATVEFFAADGRSIGTATADSRGTYVFGTGLPPGQYYAATTQPGYQRVVFNAVVCPGCSPTTGTPITISGSSGIQAGIDFALPSAP
ncbi:MAG: carboxypeptidase regulatory-like domain-containing protein [Vicinamibacterales bacterium]